MTGIFVKGVEGISEIIASNYYGADFKISIFNQETETFIVQNISATEIKEPITIVSVSTSANQSIDDINIVLDSITGFSIGDRILIGNYIYKIINIFGNSITIHKGLLENLIGGTSCTKKGNLGIYKVPLTMQDLGEYTLIAKDNIFGLSTVKMIKVVPKSIEAMYNDIKTLEYAILGN